MKRKAKQRQQAERKGNYSVEGSIVLYGHDDGTSEEYTMFQLKERTRTQLRVISYHICEVSV